MNRRDALAQLKRFDSDVFDVMYYRTSVREHATRVRWLLEEMMPFIQKCFPDFCEGYAYYLAEVHDDTEIIRGRDPALYLKEKMGAAERDAYRAEERNAIPALVRKFDADKLYEDALWDVHEKRSCEAQVQKLGDMLDGFGEALHEVYAGNGRFLLPVGATDLKRGYIVRFAQAREKFPALAPLFEEAKEILQPRLIDFRSVAEKGKIHTVESVLAPTGYRPYDFWKYSVVIHGGMGMLVERRE